MGNVDRTVDADGNITRDVYDGLGRETSEWIGTDDSPTIGYWSPTNLSGTNMVEVSADVYDNGGMGDGNLTETISFPGANGVADADTFRVEQMAYNWQDELVASKEGAMVEEVADADVPGGSVNFKIDGIASGYSVVLIPSSEDTTTNRPITYDILDNTGAVVAEAVYDGDTVPLSSTDGVPDVPSSSLMRSLVFTTYDLQGREYQTTQYSVDQACGLSDYTLSATPPTGLAEEVNSMLFDADGNVAQTTDALGRTTTFVFDGADRETEEIDPVVYDAVTTEWAHPTTYTTYDNDGDVTEVEDPNQNFTVYVYDPAGRETREYEPNPIDGSATPCTTNPTLSTTNPETVNVFDAAGNLESVTDPLDNTTDYEYDALGRQIEMIQPTVYDTLTLGDVNPTTYTTYDGDGDVLSVTDPNTNETTYAYDDLGDMVTMTQPSVYDAIGEAYANPVTTDTYDNLGDLLQVTGPMGDAGPITTYAYNTLGEEISASEPNPASGPACLTTYFAFDALGNQVETTDPAGNSTFSKFDGFGNLAETIQPDPAGGDGTNTPETFYHYDADNELVEEVDPAGSATDPNGTVHTTAYQYDDTGRELDVSQLSGTITSCLMTDSYGVEHLVYSGSVELTTAYGFDLDGDTVTMTDPMSNLTTYDFDHLNRETEEIDPSPDGGTDHPITSFTYDFDSNQTSETDPDGNAVDSADPNVTTYAFNALNEEISQTQTLQLSASDTSPVADTTDYGYDADGNMVQETDADGQVTDFSFDALNRQIGQLWYNASSTLVNTVAYGYDLDGDLITAAADLSSYTYSYNSLGEETSVESSVSGLNGPVDSLSLPDVTLASAYDLDGNRTTLSATIGSTADFVNNYSFDTLNRETQVVQEAGGDSDAVDNKLVGFTYFADGQFDTIDYYNSTSTSDEVMASGYGYDGLGRLTGLSQGNSSDADYYSDYGWAYDADSQVKSFVNSGSGDAYVDENVACYDYDNDGQLTGAVAPTDQTPNASNSLSDAYDPNGNATSINGASTTIGIGNTLLNDGTFADTYDKNGNLVQQCDSTEKIDYSYDNRNRLTDVTDYVMEDGSWAKSDEIDYTYDVFNDLIGREETKYDVSDESITSQTAQRNVFDGSNIVLSFDGSGNLTDRYLWGSAADQVLADEHFDLSGTNQLPSTSTNTLWSLPDNQGSVRNVINDAGCLEEHIAYSPFGAQTAQSTGSAVFVIGYTGTYTDATTGFQYHSDPSIGLAGRWYDPDSQEWTSEDPTGLTFDQNPRTFADNAPVDRLDPDGLDSWEFTTANAIKFVASRKGNGKRSRVFA